MARWCVWSVLLQHIDSLISANVHAAQETQPVGRHIHRSDAKDENIRVQKENEQGLRDENK